MRSVATEQERSEVPPVLFMSRNRLKVIKLRSRTAAAGLAVSIVVRGPLGNSVSLMVRGSSAVSLTPRRGMLLQPGRPFPGSGPCLLFGIRNQQPCRTWRFP